MACPRCGGCERQDLGDERFRCLSERVITAVPPGLGGNASAAAIPITGACGHEYTADDETADAARWAKRSAEERAREDRRRALGAVEADPATPTRIAELAAKLIETRPDDAVALVAEVEIPSRLPGARSRAGWAEVDRVWPLDRFSYMWEGSPATGRIGVTRDGQLVLLGQVGPHIAPPTPTVTLTSRMLWTHPAKDPDRTVHDEHARARVLALLEKDAGTASDSIPQ